MGEKSALHRALRTLLAWRRAPFSTYLLTRAANFLEFISSSFHCSTNTHISTPTRKMKPTRDMSSDSFVHAPESSTMNKSSEADESNMIDGEDADWGGCCSSHEIKNGEGPSTLTPASSSSSSWEEIDSSNSINGLNFNDPPSVNSTSDSSWENIESHTHTDNSKQERDSRSGSDSGSGNENDEYLCGRVCKHEAFTGVRCPKKRLEERAKSSSGGESGDDSEYMCGGQVCRHEAVTDVRCPKWARIPHKEASLKIEDPIRKYVDASTQSRVLTVRAQVVRGRESRHAAKVGEIRDMAEYLRYFANEFAGDWETCLDVVAGVDNLERIAGYMEKRGWEGGASGWVEEGKERAGARPGPSVLKAIQSAGQDSQNLGREPFNEKDNEKDDDSASTTDINEDSSIASGDSEPTASDTLQELAQRIHQINDDIAPQYDALQELAQRIQQLADDVGDLNPHPWPLQALNQISTLDILAFVVLLLVYVQAAMYQVLRLGREE